MPAPILHWDLWPTVGNLVYTIATQGGCPGSSDYPPSIPQCHLSGPALTAVWSKAPPLIALCLSPLPGFKSQPGHVGKFPVTLGQAVVFARYSGFLHYLQLASHELAIIGINVTKNKIPNPNPKPSIYKGWHCKLWCCCKQFSCVNLLYGCTVHRSATQI